NKKRTYRAAAVVLAAGSMESPKIALRSQLTNPNNRTGVGLTDHGSFFLRQDYEIPAGTQFAGKDKFARIFLYADGNAPHKFNTEIELNGTDYFRVRHANRPFWNDFLARKNRTTIGFKITCGTPLVDTNFVRLAPNPDDKVEVSMKPTPF